MPAIGGTKTPLPLDLLERAKSLYLQGLKWAEVAELTGLKESSLTRIASIKGWTAFKAESKAKAELEGLRPLLHGKLSQAVTQVKIPKSTSAKRLQPVADFIHTATQSAKDLEGWAPSAGNTLVNVAVLSECVLSPATMPDNVKQCSALSDSVDVESSTVPAPDQAGPVQAE